VIKEATKNTIHKNFRTVTYNKDLTTNVHIKIQLKKSDNFDTLNIDKK